MKTKKRARPKGERVALWIRKGPMGYEISHNDYFPRWVLIGGLCSFGFRFWFRHLKIEWNEGPVRVWITIQRAGRKP